MCSEWRLQAQRAARPSHSSSATFPSPRHRASCALTAHDLHLLVAHPRCTPKPLLGRGSWEQHAARTPARPAWARALARASTWGWTAGHGLPNGVGPVQLFAHVGPPPPVLPPAQPARAACPVSGTQGRGLAARGVLRGIALGLMRLSFSRVFYTCSFSCVCSSFMPICDWGYLLKLHVFFMYMYVRVCVHTYVCIVQVQILFQYRYCNIFSLSVACLPVYFF